MVLALPLNKPNPDVRLARKREAARMRQQRCRARKRQALIVKRRQPEESHHRGPLPHVESRNEENTEREKPSPFREGPPTSYPSRDPIFKIVSFDSPISTRNETSMFVSREPACPRVIDRVSSVESSLSSSSSPDKRPITVKVERSDGKESLVKEEEAAIVAMLSLKASDSPKAAKTSPRSPPPTTPTSIQDPRIEARTTVPVSALAKPSARDRKYAYYADWEQYRYPYSYGRYTQFPPPPYYPVPPRVWTMNYRYQAYTNGSSSTSSKGILPPRERYE